MKDFSLLHIDIFLSKNNNNVATASKETIIIAKPAVADVLLSLLLFASLKNVAKIFHCKAIAMIVIPATIMLSIILSDTTVPNECTKGTFS